MKWNLTISFKKIFIIFILIQPILDEYGILNVSGSISDISLLYSLPIIVFMLIFKLKSQMNRFNLQYLPFFCWLIISLLVTLTTNTFNLGDIFNDYLRTLLYYFIVIFIINQYMDVRFAKRALEVLSLFLGAYCLLQYIFMFFCI